MAGFAIPFFEFVNTTRRYFGGDVGAREGRELTELPETTTRTAFGAEPGVTFSVAEEEQGKKTNHLLHAYGGDNYRDGREFSSIQVGVPLPAEKRLHCCRQLFNFFDEERKREVEESNLQVMLHLLGLQTEAKNVLERFGEDGVLSIEGFMLYASSAEERTKMRLMIPIDLLLEIRSLMNLLIRGKKLDRDNLKAFVAILGLDWAVEDIQAFMQEKDRTCTSFIDQLAIKIRLGNEPGNRTLRVRNWWPGRWYICREEENGEEQLFLLLENPEVEGGWQEAGKVLTAGNFTSQPFIIGFRVSGNNRFNVLISKMDPRRNDYLRLEAEEMARRTDPFGRAPGVLSPDLIVEIVKRFHHYADLTALGRKELVRRVVEIAIGDAETFQIDAIMVVLKLLGNHAEPQHVTYLLQSTSVEKPDTTALYVREVEPMLLGMDMMLTVPLDLLKRMRTAWARVDMIDAEGTGALNAQQLKHMSNIMGLGWKSKEIAAVLLMQLDKDDARMRFHPEEVLNGSVRLDWIQFLDTFVEIYGDPFFEKRYRELYELLDVDRLNALSDEDLIPLLVAAGLELHEAEEALGRLLGNNLTLDARQFAAGIFEAELTGEAYPSALHSMARAYLNIDTDAKGYVDQHDLDVVFQKLGARFESKHLNNLFKQLDRERAGKLTFGELMTRLSRVDTSKIGPLAEFWSLKKLCQVTSYEIATTIQELNAARDTEGRPVLERVAQKMIMTASKKGAQILERREMQRRRRAGMDYIYNDPLLEPIVYAPGNRRWIFWLCYFNIARCFMYGLASGGLNYLTEEASNKYFPINEDEAASTKALSNYKLYLHYLTSFAPGIIFSFIEALVISYDFLATAISLTNTVNVSLYKEPMDPLRVFICNAITAEALELGHPNNVRYGINPLKGSNKFMLWFCGVLYAMRSGLSKFLIKIILRRVVSRSAIRGASNLVSIPIVAFWNSVLAVTVNSNVRTVALCRSNITVMLDTILALHVELQRQMSAGIELQQAVDLARTRSHAMDNPHVAFHPSDVTHGLKEMIIRACAVAVVINREFHPNLEQAIKHLKTRFRIEPETIDKVDDFTVFMAQFKKLDRLSSYTVLAILLLALITDGVLRTSQKVMFKQVMSAAGFEPDSRGLKKIVKLYTDLILQPKDIAFVMFELREQQAETVTTIVEQIEVWLSSILRFLSF